MRQTAVSQVELGFCLAEGLKHTRPAWGRDQQVVAGLQGWSHHVRHESATAGADTGRRNKECMRQGVASADTSPFTCVPYRSGSATNEP
jgi:hypothetical protein